MAKEDVVRVQMEIIHAAQDQAIVDGLGVCYDQGAADQKAVDGTFGQADIDAAVAAAVAPLQMQLDAANAQLALDAGVIENDAKVLAEMQAKAAEDIAAVQKALEEMTAKELMEEQAVADVQAKVLAVEASFAAIKAILIPNG